MSGDDQMNLEAGHSLPFWRRVGSPAVSLIAAAILLPAFLFGLAAWAAYRETLRESEARVERTARILEEHALKVFETHRLVIQEVNTRMRFVDFAKEADRVDLYKLLKQLQDDLDQVATVTVAGPDGHMLASGRIYPFDPKITFQDRDYFQTLKHADSALPVVSRTYPGRTSGILIFNVAARIDPRQGPFKGTIAVSVDRAYFEHFYETVEPAFDHTVDLVRDDGQILARVPTSPMLELPQTSLFRAEMRKASLGHYMRVSRIDGVERMFAFRKIGDYPVFVRFGISMQGALAPWKRSLIAYGIVALLASLALVGVSLLALRQTGRERHARRRWEETAAALRDEAAVRGRVEEQLRQSQKMEALGRLTGGVAHDFNNLLTAVIGSLDLVRRRPDAIDGRSLELVGNALEGANRAASLTNRLLAFSRQQPLQPSRLDANSLVAGMSDLMCRTLGEHVTVETALAAGLWPILADPNQLESAILNLAVNARDAMLENGGGRLRIATDNVHVSKPIVGAQTELAAGDYVAVSVADTGTGMSPEVLANIFEPFYTTKPVGKGTGLGLSQVYGFLKQSGGHVEVESTPGQGSTFKLYLPRAMAGVAVAPRVAAVADATTSPSGHGETIVVVEDEPMVRRLSVAALEDAGYRVLAASDGLTGLELLRGSPNVALLFTDVVLGGAMNGRALADAIHAERPNLPVLFTTGYTRDAIVGEGRVREGVALIQKPFTGAALVAKVADMLRVQGDDPVAAPHHR